MATVQNAGLFGVSIQCRYKNASQWQESDTLLAGEIGIELDTGKGKVGDGTKTWGQLDYTMDPSLSGLITALTQRVTTGESDIVALQGKDTEHETRMSTIEAKDTEQDTAISNLQSKDTEHDTAIEGQGQRISALEGITVISANPAPSV